MKRCGILAVCSMWLAFVATASPVADSLRLRLDELSAPEGRIAVLLNLMDLTESSPDEMLYARTLYREATAVGDRFAVAAAVGPLSFARIERGEDDSLFRFLAKADGLLRDTPFDGVTEYYRMAAWARCLQEAPPEQSAAECDRITALLDARKPHETAFEAASRLFLEGVISYQLLSLAGENGWSKGIPYWEEAWDAVQSFPPQARKNFSANLCICLLTAYAHIRDGERLKRVADRYLELLDEYYASGLLRRRRPYIYKDIDYMLCYQRLVSSSRIVGRQTAHRYFLRYADFMKRGRGDALLRDPSFYFETAYAHYLDQDSLERALAFKDSLIVYMRAGRSYTHLNPHHYSDRARLLQQLGRYRAACDAYEQALALADSVSRQEYFDRVGEMRARFDVDRLELANTRLVASKRKTALLLTLAILAAALVVVGYLTRTLRRIERLQWRLRLESRRAQEGERMKAAFIRSICHEIRTPLNAINGFSEVLFDPTVAEADKRDMTGIIRENTALLTSMVDGLIVLSDLDATEGTLPVGPADLGPLIDEAVARLRTVAPGVRVDVRNPPPTGCRAEVHTRYFGQMLDALLGNALRFGQGSTVTIGCACGSRPGRIEVSVADEGPGIPAAQHEEVFRRFVKLDPFSPGSGLGLSVARAVARRMGGEVRIDSSHSPGARFVVDLPAA